MCILLFEISSLISREMSNIYYWEKLTFLKLWFSRKKNLKTCTSFEEQKVTRCIRENAYFGIISFNCLSSTNLCLRSLFIYFAWEIKDLYQSTLFFFLIGIHSLLGWTATTRHWVTRKEAQKILQDPENLFRKNLQLKDVC